MHTPTTLFFDYIRVYSKGLVPPHVDEEAVYEAKGDPIRSDVLRTLRSRNTLLSKTVDDTVFVIAVDRYDSNLYNGLILCLFTDAVIERYYRPAESVRPLTPGHEREELSEFLDKLAAGETVRAYLGGFLGDFVYVDLTYKVGRITMTISF